MNQKTMIKGKIHYVGVNDRNKHLFEGLWPLIHSSVLRRMNLKRQH